MLLQHTIKLLILILIKLNVQSFQYCTSFKVASSKLQNQLLKSMQNRYNSRKYLYKSTLLQKLNDLMLMILFIDKRLFQDQRLSSIQVNHPFYLYLTFQQDPSLKVEIYVYLRLLSQGSRLCIWLMENLWPNLQYLKIKKWKLTEAMLQRHVKYQMC